MRRGANPNARDSFGDAVLLDVRDAEMASALIASGPDVDVRHTGDNDTPLIRASRMGLTPLVQVLLGAGANVQAEMAGGATALSEAERGGHEDIVALLRAAAARWRRPGRAAEVAARSHSQNGGKKSVAQKWRER